MLARGSTPRRVTVGWVWCNNDVCWYLVSDYDTSGIDWGVMKV